MCGILLLHLILICLSFCFIYTESKSTCNVFNVSFQIACKLESSILTVLTERSSPAVHTLARERCHAVQTRARVLTRDGSTVVDVCKVCYNFI